ncbi:MAG TPA: formate/nitrite transporter family protein [Azospirillaceae bacterium]|nr:formate/nitrite transporter family protein [Azospirillaceae bacterium]
MKDLTPAHSPAQVDALPPDAIAVRLEELGASRARRDTAGFFALAVLAGIFISFGAMFSTTVMAGAADVLPFGMTRLLGGGVFALGLIMVVIGGAQMFTGDVLMVMAWASGKLAAADLARAWVVGWLGNLVGAVGMAVLVFLSGQYMFGHGAVGAAALSVAAAKTALPADQAFFLGVLCNVLVCVAVWMTAGGRSVVDKVVVIVPPIAAFVAAGFEHCVANMYLVPLGLLIQWGAPDAFWTDLGRSMPAVSAGGFVINLASVTLGNLVGGALLVGGMYWFVYRRPIYHRPGHER